MEDKNYTRMQQVLAAVNPPTESSIEYPNFIIEDYPEETSPIYAENSPEPGTYSIKRMNNPKKASEIARVSNDPSYKYNEGEFMEELRKHVDGTYVKHYGGSVQPVEFIMSNAETLDYLKGNVVKYIYRYGKKDGHNKADLYKAVHFIMMMAKYEDKK